MTRRDWPRASNLAARWIVVDPLADDAVAALVESQFLNGEPAAARQTYGQYVSRIEAAGRRPGRTIQELMSRIDRADTARVHRETRTPAGVTPSFHASLVRRTTEWEVLSQRRAAAMNGECAIAVIEGEPGAGKTRLADDFFRCVELRSGVVLRGRGHDASMNAPYAAVIDIVRSAINAPGLAGVDPRWLAELANLVPELRNSFTGLPSITPVGEVEGRLIFEATSQVIQAIAEESSLAVFVDDLHWCDEASCGLLHSLIRRFESAPVFWCATFTPGVVERDAPAARLVRTLRASRGAVSISLQSLTAEDVWRLYRELAQADASNGAPQLAARIFDVTAGNPFYIIELLKTLFAQGVLTVDTASRRWVVKDSALAVGAPLDFAPPLHVAIAERIACLPEELGAVLITLAVAGDGCRTYELSHVHGISRLRASALGDRLVERHLAMEQNGVYQCAHPVIARAVRDGLTTSRRQEVHRALALTLELLLPADANSDAFGAIARHAEQAGERTMARRYTVRASEPNTQPPDATN